MKCNIFTDANSSKIHMLKWFITLLLPFIIWMIPTSPQFTSDLRLFFVITLFTIILFAFEFFPVLVPSILLSTLYFLSGLVPAKIAFSSWTETTVWMIIGALIQAHALEECGLLKRIALWCIRKCGGTFTGTMYGIFITGMVIGFVTFSNGFIIMMTLVYGICRAMNFERSDKAALLCLSGMMGGVSTCVFLYSPARMALIEAGVQTIIPGFAPNWYDSLLYNWPIAIMVIVIIWVLTKVYKTNEITFKGGREYFDRQYEELGPLSAREKKGVIVTLILMVYLLTCPLHKLPPAFGFMTLPYLLFMPGINVATQECIKKLNFSIIFFLGACLSIGVVGAKLGCGALITQMISPVIAGHSSLTCLLLMISFGLIANLFMTPYAMLAALSMPFVQVGMDVGLNPLSSTMSLMLSTDMIFFPYEITGCLVMYSFGLISMSNFIKLNVFKTAMYYVFFVAVIFPYWKFMGLL